MPPIGKVLGNVDFSQLAVDLGDGVAIRYGAFINAVIAFLIVRFVVWQLSWQLSKMFVREEAAADTKTCPYCKEPNALDATKCRACASGI